jgi:hypothetical protein
MTRVEEVRTTSEGVHVVSLFEFAAGDDRLRPTGVVDRGESVLLSTLAAPDESYADVRTRVEARTEALERHAETGLTAPGEREY